MDSRGIPHTLNIRVGGGGVVQHYTIEKASERVKEADIYVALSPRAPSSPHISVGV